MDQELAGKVAIITGGASGIGRATAELFAAEGARVLIADLNAEAGEEVAAELGDAAIFHRTDVARADEVQAAVDRAVAQFGGLHIMFNNAGVPDGPPDPFLTDDLKNFERVIGVNLFGVVAGTQRAARHMAEHGGGSIINTTSIGGIKPGGGIPAYRSAKAGVIHFSKSVAIELGPLGIRVNCIAPGLIPTAITNYDQAAVRKMMQPLNRAGSPRDIAEAALYLASERAAQVTGIVLTVDGGATLGAPVHIPR